MATIATQLNLGGNMSPVLQNMTRALNITISSFQKMQNVSRRAVDAKSLNTAKELIANIDKQLDEVANSVIPAETNQGKFNRRLNEGTSNAGNLLSKVKGIVTALGIGAGIKMLGGLSDKMTGIEARLDLIVDDGGSVQGLEDKIFASAQRSRANYMETMQTVSKLGVLAGDSFSSNDEMIAFSELMNKNFKIGGASVQEQASAMTQLTQAMASGVLQGDEYRSIIENAPLLAKSIEDYMRNVQGVEGSMKDWASQGLLTADVIKAAMFNSADETEQRFANIPKTWGDLWTDIQNQGTQALQPLLKKISDLANNPEIQNMINNMMAVFSQLVNYAVGAFDVIGKVALWVKDNLSWIAPVVKGIVAAFVAYKAITTAVSVVQAIFNLILAANPIILIIAVIVGVIAALVAWGASIGGLKYVWLICVNAILTAWDWIKIGFFTGVYWVIDLCANMALAFQTAGVNIANFMGDMKANVLMLLQNMVNSAIDIINGFIGILNKIPGVSIDAIANVSFGTEAQLQNEAEKQARNARLEAYQLEIEGGKAYRASELERMKQEAMAGEAARLVEAEMAKQEHLDKKALSENDVADGADMEGYDYSQFMTDTGTIADNTSEIAENTANSAENLKLLREIAERSAINKFTTAEVKVDMTGMSNKIDSDQDIDGFMTKFTDKLQEALLVTAEGVHV